MDDGELIAATVRGDADAFAKLYRRHLSRVVAFALRATGDPEVAADLAAEVFAAALASCARYRAEHDSAALWLLGIAQNKLRESRRRDRLEAELRAAVPRAVSTRAPTPRRRNHLRSGMASAAIGVAVALAVVVLAVLLLGRDHPSSQTAGPKPPTESAVPTLRQLLDNFATLRRAQTAADRSWQPKPDAGARELPALTRLARTLPNGDRVFLTVEQRRTPSAGQAAGTYSMKVWVVDPTGSAGTTSFGPKGGYNVFPFEFPSSSQVVSGDGIAAVKFGEPRTAAVAALNRLLGVPGGPYRPGGLCDFDHTITWRDQRSPEEHPSLIGYFAHGRLVGYEYGEAGNHIAVGRSVHDPLLATIRGLTVGDTLERGRRLYGSSFTISTAQGGSWKVATPSGSIDGYASDVPRPGNLDAVKIRTIDAGSVGCPAEAP